MKETTSEISSKKATKSGKKTHEKKLDMEYDLIDEEVEEHEDSSSADEVISETLVDEMANENTVNDLIDEEAEEHEDSSSADEVISETLVDEMANENTDSDLIGEEAEEHIDSDLTNEVDFDFLLNSILFGSETDEDELVEEEVAGVKDNDIAETSEMDIAELIEGIKSGQYQMKIERQNSWEDMPELKLLFAFDDEPFEERFYGYQVEEPFEDEYGESWIYITYSFKNGENKRWKYIYKTIEDVYESLRINQYVDLDYTYIKGLQLGEFLGRMQINGFSAIAAFFDVDKGCTLSIKGCQFAEKITFRSGNFASAHVDLSHFTFEDGITFSAATFGKCGIDFFGSTIIGKLDFRSVAMLDNSLIWISKTDINNATIDFINFIGPKTNIFINTNNTQNTLLDYTRTNFSGLILWNCILRENLFIDVQACDFIIVQNCVIERVLTIRQNAIHGATREVRISFVDTIKMNSGCIIMEPAIDSLYHGNLYKLAKRDISPSTPKIVLEEMDFHDKAEQARMLKENFHSNGEYDEEDEAYYLYKKFRRKANYYYRTQLSKDAKGVINFMKATGSHKVTTFTFFMLKLSGLRCRITTFFEWFVFDILGGGYATKPLRVAASICTLIISFGLIYFWLGYDTNIAICIYSSVLAFLGTTIDSSLSAIVNGISAFESFLGIMFLSYLSVTIVRKVLR